MPGLLAGCMVCLSYARGVGFCYLVGVHVCLYVGFGLWFILGVPSLWAWLLVCPLAVRFSFYMGALAFCILGCLWGIALLEINS